MKISRYFTLATLALLAVVSCQKDELVAPVSPVVAPDGSLVFSVSSPSSLETKSSYVGDMELASEDGKTINVSMSVMDVIESLPDQTSQTKGALISGSNLQNYKIGLNSFLEKSSSLYINDQLKFGDDSHSYQPNGYETAHHWTPDNGHSYYWPKANALDFWAWAPYDKVKAAIDNSAAGAAVKISDFKVDNKKGELTFGYDLGATDATAQPDLMFAQIGGLTKENVAEKNTTGCVPLEFKHALSAIQFKVVSTKGAKINYIKLVDVVKTGDCKLASGAITWTDNAVSSSNKASYSHNFKADVTADTPSDFYSTDTEANFMMIPQALGTQKIEISISIDENSAPEIFVGTIPTTSVEGWAAGKVYVYTINIDENVNVTVTDEVVAGTSGGQNVKQNLTVRNSGNTKAYIRAAIVANWVDERGHIINSAWNPTNGSWTVNKAAATAPGGAGTGWTLGDDGFYYYKYQVPGGAETIGKLFDSYTPAAAPANAHLEMQIVVQAIQANMLINPNGTSFKEGTAAYGWETGKLDIKVDNAENFN